MKNIDWSAPNPIFAVAAFLLLLLFASKKKRFTFTYLLSAIIAGAGFMLSSWVGILAVSMAISYRVFQSLRAPWQAVINLAAGISLFAGLTWLIHKLDPASKHPQPSKPTDGWGGQLKDITNHVATSGFLTTICLIGGLFAAIYVYWYMRKHIKNPYLGQGNKANPEQMYRGIVNPNFTTLPENQRDPKRTFSLKMREEMLKDQKGLCRYQKLMKSHPNWEPYRDGIQWEGDHIIPHAVGGATNYANLQILCADCNSAKSSKLNVKADDAVDAMWKKKKGA